MNNKDNRTQQLIREINVVVAFGAGGLIIVCTLLYFMLAYFSFDRKSHPAWSSVRDFVMTLSTELIPVFLLFVCAYLLFGRIQVIRSEQEHDELTRHLAQAVRDDLKPLFDWLDSATHRKSINLRQFDNIKDVYEHVAIRLLGAKHTIQDLTWGSYTGYRTEDEQHAYDEYVKTMHTVCQKGTIEYKEVSSLSDAHYFGRATSLFEYYSYHLGYHDISTVKVPLISYIIIDGREVVAGFSRIPGTKTPPEGIAYMSARNPLVVKFFENSFEAIWATSEKLKEAGTIARGRVQEIQDHLSLSSIAGNR